MHRIEEIVEASERLRKEIQEFSEGLSGKGRKGSSEKESEELDALEDSLKSIRMEIAKLTSQINNIKSSMNQEKKRAKEIETSVKEVYFYCLSTGLCRFAMGLIRIDKTLENFTSRK